MPISAKDVFNRLSEWPHRGVGTEEEMEAREALITSLTAEFEVDIKEEGFVAPASYLPFMWFTGSMTILAIMGAGAMPSIMLLLGVVASTSVFLFFDWRISPLVWWGGQKTTANLVASKGQGRRLFILMAHIDSAPASFAYRPQQIPHFRASIYAAMGLSMSGVLLPLLASLGVPVSFDVQLVLSMAILIHLGLASIDYWRFGYTPGANDNLTGVAAATSAASHLWLRMPDDAEVRLVITSAEEAGMLGAQHYWQTHRAELKARDTYVINIDTVGCENLRYVTQSGGFTPLYYRNRLIDAAQNVVQLNEVFMDVQNVHHHTGDFDSVWFARDGVTAMTLTSCDANGHMTAIHTPGDTVDKVSMGTMNRAARFAEAIVRTCPRG